MDASKQQRTNNENENFWDEPCGTILAKSLGIEDSSKESLLKYDANFFSFYPYLAKHIPYAAMNQKKVLEVGLGFGSVAQKIAESGALYHGLDIAAGPVALARKRLEQNGLQGHVNKGNFLNCPYEDNFFDFVVSIGCFHHTGNMQRAIDEAYRVLKPGGTAIIMVYSAYSYRQWISNTSKTATRFINEFFLKTDIRQEQTENERGAYDRTTDGIAAPEVVFTSRLEFKKLARKFSTVQVWGENIENLYVFKLFGRDIAGKLFGNLMGLDIYCTCVK